MRYLVILKGNYDNDGLPIPALRVVWVRNDQEAEIQLGEHLDVTHLYPGHPPTLATHDHRAKALSRLKKLRLGGRAGKILSRKKWR